MYPQFLQIYSVQGGLFMQYNIIFRFSGQAGQKPQTAVLAGIMPQTAVLAGIMPQ